MAQRNKMLPVQKRRRGAAVAELAVCLPTIAMLLLGSVECCNMIFVQQGLSVAAYEGARTATRRDSTNADITSHSTNIITARKINSATVTISSADVTQLAPGTQITVTVKTTCAANSFLPPWFFAGRSLGTHCTMVRE
jgi:Flp pilus assembly protein TadG